MDNLSHALAGLAAGELLQRSLAPEPSEEAQAQRRRMLLTTCALAANLPDLDLVLTPLLPAPLGYLLHHRGHTHTLLYALPQALALIALVWLLWPNARRLLQSSATARTGLLAATAIGLLLHLLMDFLNSYGLHPFHPIDSRWLYGDMVFILEPVFWVGFGVPLAMMVQRRWLKIAYLTMLTGVLAASTALGFLHWTSLVALLSVAVLLGWVQHRSASNGKQGLVFGMLAAAAFVGLQGWASTMGRAQVAAHLQAIAPSGRLLDVAMTPYPANPACWSFVSVELIDGAGAYRVRRGLLSLAPKLLPVASCPAAMTQPFTATSSAIALVWESETDLRTLRTLANNCHVHAWMRFARAPFLADGVLDDARFSGRRAPADEPVEAGPRPSFSTFHPAQLQSVPCAVSVPQWDLPRQDLLNAASQ